MPKIPRDLSGRGLAALLKAYGYETTRQTGSHIRLTAKRGDAEHHITIPDHAPLKIGTLGNVLRELAEGMDVEREILVKKLFGD